MKQFLLTLFCIISTCVYSQSFCNNVAQFPDRAGANTVTFKSVSNYGLYDQIWIYSVKSSRTEPSFIFFHNPCVNIIETGIIRNGNRIKRNLINHVNSYEPNLNSYGWKLEFYSDSIYIITQGQFEVKPIFISMKYGRSLVTDTICGPDCTLLSLSSVTLMNDSEFIMLIDSSNRLETYELRISIDGVYWDILSYITSNTVYKLSNLRPGIWYLIAKNSHLESNIIRVTVSGFNTIYSIDELGRRTLNDPRSIKPNIW